MPQNLPKLLIITDLWGDKNARWLNTYVQQLEKKFEIVIYNAQQLAKINKKNQSEKEIHTQFVQNGIENAVLYLIQHETSPVHILAFSIGGTIAWRFGLKTDCLQSLTAISSTRLRHEKETPLFKCLLIFGEKDPYLPTNKWFDKMEINPTIISAGNHDIYTQEKVIKDLCSMVLAKI